MPEIATLHEHPAVADAASINRRLSRAERAQQTETLLHAAYETDDPAEADELRGRVILVNRTVAEAVARRYQHRGVAADDLAQVAYEGLTKAALRFDPTLRNDFLTYAVPTIRGEIQRYFRDQGWTVRPPRRIQELQGRITAAIRDLEQALGREPTEQEVADHLEISPAEYREAIGAVGCFHPTSLDLPIGSDMSTLGDLLADEDSEAHDASDARVMLQPAVRGLPERDRRILYLRFVEDLTQEEIGAELGVTQMQVSRLLSRILRELRHELQPTG